MKNTYDKERISKAADKARKCPHVLRERYFKALQLRDDGMTFGEVGNQLGCSATRARDIVCKAVDRIEECPLDAPREIPVIMQRLKKYGFDSKEKIIEGLKQGIIHPRNKKLWYYGAGSHKILCDWVGFNDERKEKNISNDQTKMYVPDAPRNVQVIVRLLARFGFDTREKIIEGIKNGDIQPHRFSGYGKKKHEILSEWFLFGREKHTKRKTSKVQQYIDFLKKHGYEVKKRS